jgi:hypothetical protein
MIAEIPPPADTMSLMPDHDLDRLLSFLWSLKEAHVEAAAPMLAAESALGKDWLTPEEDAAWGNL